MSLRSQSFPLPHLWGWNLNLLAYIARPSQEDLSQFHDYISFDPRYWLYHPGQATHHAPTSTSHIRYGMPDIPKTDPTPNVELVGDPGTGRWGTSIPFHVERFGNSSHIAPSTLAVKIPSHTHPRPSTSVPLRGPQPRHVNIGGTSYIPSHIPSSSQLVPSNSFLTHPLHNSCGPLSWSLTVSHVHPASTNTIVS